ncbi:MAG: hypothetical protein GXX79_15055 [Actinomycetales bacterium]|nr:hypothetical protein [Actinomycetales bacterium]
MLDRYLEVLDIEETTRRTYVGYIDRYIRPVLGSMPAGKVGGEVVDAFYAQLRRCRQRCIGRVKPIEHRTVRALECDERCRRHECRPLSASSVRQIHRILSGAFERAVRWNPVGAKQYPSRPTDHRARGFLDTAIGSPCGARTRSASARVGP